MITQAGAPRGGACTALGPSENRKAEALSRPRPALRCAMDAPGALKRIVYRLGFSLPARVGKGNGGGATLNVSHVFFWSDLVPPQTMPLPSACMHPYVLPDLPCVQ